MTHYCTYFDRNYLAKGVALVNSLNRHEEDDFVLFIICLDEITRTVMRRLNLPNVVLVPIHEIEENDADLLEAKSNRSVVEYYWTATPTIILRLLEQHPEIQVLTYVDSDLYFYSDPAPIRDELSDKSVLIHAHRFPPYLAHLEQYGKYNVGLVCFRNDSKGLEVLKWWRARCNEWCYAYIQDGKFGDQLYLNDWTTRFDRVIELENVAAGVAPWNHAQYEYDSSDAGPTVDRNQLIFYHFHSILQLTADLVVPAKHVVYPITQQIIELCFLPYLRELDDTLELVRKIMPEWDFGFTPGSLPGAQAVFLARHGDPGPALEVSNNRRQIQLSDEWTLFESDQLIEPGQDPKIVDQNAGAIPAIIPGKSVHVEIELPATLPEKPLVTAIVSTYKSERFIRGCLEDLLNQTIADQLEIVVVDSASPENERALIEDFQKLHPNIHYIRTSERETIYGAWNRAIGVARGKYITNANTDDRHRHDALEVMARVLDQHAEVGAAYADVLVTETENETFERNTQTGQYRWVDFSLRAILKGCFFGPQPMWRRSVHSEIGLFREDYVSAGDYDFAIRVGWKFGAIHIRELLGLYVKRPDSVEHRESERGLPETKETQNHHRKIIPLEDIYPGLRGAKDPALRALCLTDMGNTALTASVSDPEQALEFYAQAIAESPDLLPALHNAALVRAANFRDENALRNLGEFSRRNQLASANFNILTGRATQGTLTIMEAEGPEITRAAEGRGVDVSAVHPGIDVVLVSQGTRSRLKHVLESLPGILPENSSISVVAPSEPATILDDANCPESIRLNTNLFADLVDAFEEELPSANQYSLILSSDVDLLKDDLERLILCAGRDKRTAAVGPCSGEAPTHQRVSVDYKSMKKIRQFARKRSMTHSKQSKSVPFLGIFCLLLNKEHVKEAGGLARNSDNMAVTHSLVMNLFETLKENGHLIVRADDVWVYHEKLTPDEGRDF